MPYQQIIYETDRTVATITLNRPDRLNAWTPVMEGEVRRAIAAAISDDAVRAIVLTGAGRGFCAGADASALETMIKDNVSWNPAEEVAKTVPLDGAMADYRNRMTYFPGVSKPMIAAVNGTCAGAGFVLSLYCDIRFASEDASFITVFARRGLIAENGLAWLLSRTIGPARALDLLMSSRKVGAGEAFELGLVNRVTPAEELLAAAQQYARDLGTLVSPRSIRIMKKQVWESHMQTLQESVRMAEVETAKAIKSEDFKEGVASYLERRPPNFTGN